MAGTKQSTDYTINCTGDIVVGDKIEFVENVYTGGSYGRFRKPAKFVGTRTIRGEVINDSYGEKKQQHTFTLMVSDCQGIKPVANGILLRKGRNIYRDGTFRKPWANESLRKRALNEKHDRGSKAREDRMNRRIEESKKRNKNGYKFH